MLKSEVWRQFEVLINFTTVEQIDVPSSLRSKLAHSVNYTQPLPLILNNDRPQMAAGILVINYAKIEWKNEITIVANLDSKRLHDILFYCVKNLVRWLTEL